MKRFLIPPIALISLILILLAACGSAEFSSDESVLTQNMSDEKLADSRARGASGPSGEAGVFTSRSKAVAPEPSFGAPAAISKQYESLLVPGRDQKRWERWQ